MQLLDRGECGKEKKKEKMSCLADEMQSDNAINNNTVLYVGQSHKFRHNHIIKLFSLDVAIIRHRCHRATVVYLFSKNEHGNFCRNVPHMADMEQVRIRVIMLVLYWRLKGVL